MFSKRVIQEIQKENAIDPVDENEIKSAERALGFVFREEYRWLIKNFGFLVRGSTSISGVGALDQQENVVFLNIEMLKKIRDRLPKGYFAISYENDFDSILVLDNNSGRVFKYDYQLNDGIEAFKSLSDLLKIIYMG